MPKKRKTEINYIRVVITYSDGQWTVYAECPSGEIFHEQNDGPEPPS
jgi:hypothetical protein